MDDRIFDRIEDVDLKKKMEDSDMPEAFRGLPGTLLYIGGLALAFYALAGRGVVTLL